ncbi:MAG: endonuclease domain-containing protein [Salinivirgaceae bacterium]|nr:endonuclease domain-containing protein [Salinivirgaceae bacterium]
MNKFKYLLFGIASNKDLKERASVLRPKGTKSEAYMWKFVLSKKTMGYKFLRQRPVLHFIADFMCPELMLIIECDGATHLLPGADKKDLKRQTKLEELDFTVIRFEDGMVINHIGTVCTIVEQTVKEQEELLGLKESQV